MIKTVIVEDSQGDCELMAIRLQKVGLTLDFQRVDNEDEFCLAISDSGVELIICDYSLSLLDAHVVLDIYRKSDLDIPFIVVSEIISEDSAVRMMREGAHDYILKRNMVRLGPAIERELNEARARLSRREALKALSESEATLRLVIESVQDCVWDWNLKTAEAYYSQSWANILGYELAELRNDYWFWEQRVHPDDYGSVIDALNAHINGLSTRFFHEYRIQTKSGDWLWVLGRGKVVEHAGVGEPLRMVGTMIDIDSQKKLEQELRSNCDEALRIARFRSEFLANMSHEIRTPMNGVLGMLELLQESGLNEEQMKFAQTGYNSGETLLVLLNNILNLSKAESGKLELEEIEFDLRHAIENVMEMLAQKAHDKGLEMACLNEASLPTRIKGDPTRIKQVLTNLMSNAVKFTEKGEVLLRARSEPSTEEDGMTTVVIEVQDTGIGISQDKVELVFEAFSQENGSITRRYGGTGLGLAISRQLAVMMGGVLSVKSIQGKGSLFTFKFPVNVIEHSDANAQFSRDIKSLRILVLDSSDLGRLYLEHAFRNWGIGFRGVLNSAECLNILRDSAARNKPYDIVFVDKSTSGVNVFEFSKTVNAIPNCSHTKLIMISHLGERGDSLAAREAGYSAYLTKPIREVHLRDCLTMVTSDIDLPEIVTRHSLEERRETGKGARVLVVDDDEVTQKVAVNMLYHLGYASDVVNDGIKAVEAVSQGRYSLVLMDLDLPGIDGCAASQQIRKSNKPSGQIPIVALSAHVQMADKQRCFEAGMDDFLAKPMQLSTLQEVLSKWGAGRREGCVAEGVTLP